MRYAYIENGIVTNVIWLNETNAQEFPNAVQSDIACIGDEYRDGRFWREGEMAPTLLEQYAALAIEAQDMREALEILGLEGEEITDEDV